MITLLAWFALLSVQATYGPTMPPSVETPAPDGNAEPQSTMEQVLRSQGMSDGGLRALRAIPLPSIARGATRAAQCAVEQLRERDPLPVSDLVSAMDERDATAAAQAQARTRYLAAALPMLAAPDQRVLLAVLGDGAAIGGEAPPRPAMARPGGRPPGGPGAGRGGPGGGRGGPGGGGGFGGAGGDGGMAGGPRPGGIDRSNAGRTAGRPDGPPAGFSLRGPVSPCERYLAD